MSEIQHILSVAISGPADTSAPAGTSAESKKTNDKKVKAEPGKTYFGAWLGESPLEMDIDYTGDRVRAALGVNVLRPVESVVYGTRLIVNYRFDQYIKSVREYEADIKEFSGLTGKKPKILSDYVQWNNSWAYSAFPTTFCAMAGKAGAIPMITWEPSGLPFKTNDPSKTYLDEFNDQFNKKSGKIYEYALMWAKAAKAYGKPFLLRPFHEMNLRETYPWTAWMNGGDAGIEKVKEAWINLYKLFKEVGADNATFVWCPNNKSYPAENWNTIDKYYPGDAYVDWIGIDGYRKGTETVNEGSKFPLFNSVFGKSLPYLRSKGKPLIICETSSSPDEKKPQYINELFEASKYYGISAVCWFNENKEGMGADEKNWLIDAPEKTKKQMEQEEDDLLFGKKKEAKKEENEVPVVNNSLDAFRKVGIDKRTGKKDEAFIYEEAPITENIEGVTQKKDRKVRVPVEKARLEEKAKAKREWLEKNIKYLPLPGAVSAMRIDLAEVEEKLAGYEAFRPEIIADQTKDVRPLMARKYEAAMEQLEMVHSDDREYLKALAKMKDILNHWVYLDFIEVPDISPAAIRVLAKKEYKDAVEYNETKMGEKTVKTIIAGKKFTEKVLESLLKEEALKPYADKLKELFLWAHTSAEAEGVSKNIMALANTSSRDGRKYIGSFSNVLLPWLLKYMDTTRFANTEPRGLLAASFATLGDVEAAKSDEKSYQRAIVLYLAAYDIITSPDFKKREEKEKDLKFIILIGLAKMKALIAKKRNDPKMLDEAVKELSAIAFKDDPTMAQRALMFVHLKKNDTVLPSYKVMAKLVLANSLGLYALMANDTKANFTDAKRFEMMEEAKKALIIYKGLMASGYAEEARMRMEDLSTQVKY